MTYLHSGVWGNYTWSPYQHGALRYGVSCTSMQSALDGSFHVETSQRGWEWGLLVWWNEKGQRHCSYHFVQRSSRDIQPNFLGESNIGCSLVLLPIVYASLHDSFVVWKSWSMHTQNMFIKYVFGTFVSIKKIYYIVSLCSMTVVKDIILNFNRWWDSCIHQSKSRSTTLKDTVNCQICNLIYSSCGVEALHSCCLYSYRTNFTVHQYL